MAAAPPSSVQLQAHYDEVTSHMSVLPLSILPKQVAASLAAHIAEPSVARLAKKACSGLQECQACSCSSLPDQLQLLLSTQLEFHTRTMQLTAARFVCAQCAAVSSTNLLLQLLTPAVGLDDDSPSETRAEQLHQLCLHFAAVNNAPASITSSPDALAQWVQELACRAYSLGVVANSLKGWQLAGGPTQGCTGPQLLQQLLRRSIKSSAAAAAVTPQAAQQATALAGKAKHTATKKSKHAAAPQQQQQQEQELQQQRRHQLQQTPATEARGKAGSRGSKRGSTTAAAAGAAGGADTDQLGSRTPHKKARPANSASDKQQQQHSSLKKKHKRASSGEGAATAAAATGAGVLLRTPQHSKIKGSSSSSSSSKKKLLKSAPR